MTRNLKEFVNQAAEMLPSGDAHGRDHIAVLLAHYNGGEFLSEQLQSLAAQTHRDWSLIVSDDGSTDDWLDTVVDFARANSDHQIQLTIGPQQGFARNFLSLIRAAGPSVPFAAFCDQDDVWLPGKLARALAALTRVEAGKPALYCGRTTVCDASLVPLGQSPLFRLSPGFRNALVQSIGGGNTMVLNRAALDILQDTLLHAEDVVSHDWWAYQIVSGAGGCVLYDPQSSVFYRQHRSNWVGANNGWLARMKRARLLLQGRFRDWNDRNVTALEGASHWLTPDARETLQLFKRARHGGLIERLCALRMLRLYRQTRQGQIALWLAVILKKL